MQSDDIYRQCEYARLHSILATTFVLWISVASFGSLEVSTSMIVRTFTFAALIATLSQDVIAEGNYLRLLPDKLQHVR